MTSKKKQNSMKYNPKMALSIRGTCTQAGTDQISAYRGTCTQAGTDQISAYRGTCTQAGTDQISAYRGTGTQAGTNQISAIRTRLHDVCSHLLNPLDF